MHSFALDKLGICPHFLPNMCFIFNKVPHLCPWRMIHMQVWGTWMLPQIFRIV